MKEVIKQLNVSGNEMNQLKDDILNRLQNLSEIAKENSAITQHISSSMEEQTSSIEEISGASDSLACLAQNLQTLINKFKI